MNFSSKMNYEGVMCLYKLIAEQQEKNGKLQWLEFRHFEGHESEPEIILWFENNGIPYEISDLNNYSEKLAPQP